MNRWYWMTKLLLVGRSVRLALLNVSDPIALSDLPSAPGLEFEKGIYSVHNHRDEPEKLFFENRNHCSEF